MVSLDDFQGEGGWVGVVKPESKHNILTIPLEMFEAIAEAAEPEDLLSLRLVSRETKEKVKRTFISTHFKERMFLLSHRESLETLLAIAEHPDFGPAMKTVLLCNQELPDEEHPLVIRGRMVHRWEPDEGNTSTTRIVHELQDREWKRLTLERKNFMQHDDHQRLLVRIFQAFKSADNIPAVKLMDQAEAEMSAYGARTLEVLSARQMIWGNDDTRPVHGPLSAMKAADFSPASLTIRFDNFGFDMFRLVADDTMKDFAEMVVKTLKHVDIEHRDRHLEPSAEEIVHTAALFGRCQILESLQVRIYQDTPSKDEFLRALLQQHMPELRVLTLHGLTIPVLDLIAFQKRHQNSARLVFSRCGFVSLGVHDDGLNDKEGRQDEGIVRILRNASGLRDIKATFSSVDSWYDSDADEDPGADEGENESEDGSEGSEEFDGEEVNEDTDEAVDQDLEEAAAEEEE